MRYVTPIVPQEVIELEYININVHNPEYGQNSAASRYGLKV